MVRRPITIKFSIGRNTRFFNAGDSLATKLVTDAIADEAGQFALARLKVRVDRIQRNLARVVETEYNNAVQFAANRMIGTTSRGTAPVNIMDMMADASGGQMARGLAAASRFKSGLMMPRARAVGSVNWAPLSKQMVLTQHGMTKGNPPGPGKFFLNTGGLRATLKGFGRAMVKRTGVVRVRMIDVKGDKKIKTDTKEIEVSRLRITLMPNVYPSHLPGLRSGNLGEFDPDVRFERSLGLPPGLVDKLYGPARYKDPNREKHRPMLQPIMTYWTMVYIPNRIATVLQRAVISNRNSGLEDNSTG